MKITIDNPQAIWQIGQRDNQEDSIYPKLGEATANDRLFILCDGMGGHEHGEVASQTVSSSMATYLKTHADTNTIVPDSVLLGALEAAYKQLDKADDGNLKKMGTTLCLLLFHKGGLTAMHVGDSRIYHIRPTSDRVVYQSRDHSMVYDLYQAGEITFEEMRTSPKKNIITRALQPGEDNRVKPSIVHISNIKPGDYFYICSDGMLEQMENDQLQQLLASDKSDDEKQKQLIEETKDNKDNHSAYLIHINGVSLEQGDDQLPDDEQTTPDNAINIVPRVFRTDEGDVDIVDEPETDPIPQQQPANKRQKNSMLPVIVAAIIAVAIILVFALVKKGNNKDAEADSKVEQTQRPRSTNIQGIVSRPQGNGENISARKVDIKKGNRQQEKAEKKDLKQEEKASKAEKEQKQTEEPKTGKPNEAPKISTPAPNSPQEPTPKDPNNFKQL